MSEAMVKTHLIVKDVHEEYHINWCGRLIDTKPLLKNGVPIFAVVSNSGRVELNTIDMKKIEDCGKRMTVPKGRKAVSTDKAHVFIKEEDGGEKLVCVITHNRVKKYAPMYDKVDYK